MIKAILLDLDGVVRNWPLENDRRAEQAAGLPLGAIRQAAFAPELLLPAITGQVRDEVWRERVVDRLRRDFPEADPEAAVRLWSAWPGEVNRDVLDLVRACRQRRPVILVSNATSRLSLDLQRLGLAEAFDHVINSSEIGWIKPQVEIFEAALAAAKVSAAEAFFVDDTAENVAAASGLGIVGHLYQGIDRLKDDLLRYSLL